MVARLGIDDVRPQISGRTLPAKAVVGEVVPVSALVWREGHDAVSATLVLISPSGEQTRVPMQQEVYRPDYVHAVFIPREQGLWRFRVDAWSDPMATWRNAVEKKVAAGQTEAQLANDIAHGADLFAAAIAQTPSPGVLEAAPKLKIVGRAGVGAVGVECVRCAAQCAEQCRGVRTGRGRGGGTAAAARRRADRRWSR